MKVSINSPPIWIVFLLSPLYNIQGSIEPRQNSCLLLLWSWHSVAFFFLILTISTWLGDFEMDIRVYWDSIKNSLSRLEPCSNRLVKNGSPRFCESIPRGKKDHSSTKLFGALILHIIDLVNNVKVVQEINKPIWTVQKLNTTRLIHQSWINCDLLLKKFNFSQWRNWRELFSKTVFSPY